MEHILNQDVKKFDTIFERIGTDQMLISASDGKRANTMTASWGCAGILWNKPVALCFIRPQRFTYSIMEKNDRYSLAFFDGGFRKALAYCGTHSGKDEDKFAAAGLTCAYTEDGVPYPQEAKHILICRKLYTDILRPEAFTDPSLLAHYGAGDFHKIYVGEIEQYLSK